METVVHPPVTIIREGYPNLAVSVPHRMVATTAVTESGGTLTATVAAGHGIVVGDVIWTEGHLDSGSSAANVPIGTPVQVSAVTATSVDYPAPGGTAAGAFVDGVGIIHKAPLATTVTVNVYDVNNPGAGALNASAYTVGTEVTAEADGYSWSLDSGHANVIADIDLEAQENGHYRFEFLPDVGDVINVQMRVNVEDLYQNTVYVNTSATAPTSTAYPSGSEFRPVTTPAELLAVLTLRPSIEQIEFAGSWGGTTLTAGAIGTALQGRYIYGNAASRTNAMFAAAGNNIPVHNTIFDGVDISTTNTPALFLGVVTHRNGRVIGQLDTAGDGTNFGSYAGTGCTVEGVNVSTLGAGASQNQAWTAEFTECLFPVGAVVDYTSAAGTASSYTRCTGDVQISNIPATGAFGGTMAVSILGHQGSGTINFDATNSTAASFVVTGAVDTLINSAPMTNNGFRKISHLSDLQPEAQAALTAQGYTTARAPYLDELDAANLPTDVANVQTDVTQIRGLVLGDIVLDVLTYDANGFLTSSRLRLFADAATANAATQVQANAAGTVTVVSSNAGDTTQTATVRGLVSGVSTTDVISLNGTTPAVGVVSFDAGSVFGVTLSGATAGDLTLSDSGAATLFTVSAGTTQAGESEGELFTQTGTSTADATHNTLPAFMRATLA